MTRHMQHECRVMHATPCIKISIHQRILRPSIYRFPSKSVHVQSKGRAKKSKGHSTGMFMMMQTADIFPHQASNIVSVHVVQISFVCYTVICYMAATVLQLMCMAAECTQQSVALNRSAHSCQPAGNGFIASTSSRRFYCQHIITQMGNPLLPCLPQSNR